MSRLRLGLFGLAVAGLLACSGDADDDPVADEPEATVSVAPPPTTAPAVTTTTITITTATMPGPPLSDRIGLIEVSARIATVDTERIVSVVTDADQLAGVAEPDDRALAAAWCTGITVADPGPFLVRVVGEAVGATTGGLDGFELLGVEPTTPLGSGEIVATLRLQLDDGDLEVPDMTVLLADDPATGTFAGVTADGAAVEGAFRCE